MSRLAPALLVAAVFASGLGVIYSKHLSRRLFVELQGLEKARDAMEAQWGRLQLEQAAWAAHGRVERVARRRLHLHLPTQEQVVVVRP